ncbi:MAG TPA: NADH-quinone oxidoreductase subunit K [Ktedonobacteraceae bacterium]|jgi:hydrogenase-4 component E|nr:NADH-quinone oxidoreductase subunit K [Ktedonobacteraceae bacterium]HZU68745.1 NADH-quinone oxidoreductase subunit K [Ktedonobacteraceae bacterium]
MHPSASLVLLAAPAGISTQVLQVLGALLLLTAFATVAARHINGAIGIYAIQSFALAMVAVVVGYFTGSSDLYIVAVLTVIVKCGAIAWILRNVTNRLHLQREARPYLTIPVSLLICALLTLLAFFTSPAVVAPGTFLNEPPLAISIAMVLIGLFLLSSRRHAVIQVIGLLTIENGLFSGAIAIAYGMPLIVEFGILFDILIAVIVMSLLVTLIQRELITADTANLQRLKG